jgi:hypothetical protein
MSEKASPAQVINDAIEGALLEVHTAMPGIVVAYDPAKQVADIQPCFKRKYKDGRVVALPVISSVPVCFPRAGKAWVILPLQAGDPVTLHFMERALDSWTTQGGVVDPDEPRHHDLSDAIAVPGPAPFNAPATVTDPTAIIIQNDKSQIIITPDGKFKIKNDSNELLDVLDQISKQVKAIATSLKADTTNTMFGPMKLNGFSAYADAESALSGLITKLETLKG